MRAPLVLFLPAALSLAALPLACVGAPFTLIGTTGDAATDASFTDAARDDATAQGDAAADAPVGPLVPAGCEAAPRDDAAVVREECGIFVAPGGTDTPTGGTRAAPARTVGYALGLAAPTHKRVFVCNATYDENLVIDNATDALAIHGGLACPTLDAGAADAGDGAADGAAEAGDASAARPWSYVGGVARLAPSTATPLTIKQLARGTLIEDFEMLAPPAATSGASSVGALVLRARGVTLRRVRVVAGAGAAGASGSPATGAPPLPTADDGNPGIAGTPAIGPGGGARVCSCGTEKTIGGRGGDGNALDGNPGVAGRALAPDGGAPGYPPFPTPSDDGAGGAGATAATACAPGHSGAQPPQASPGEGGKPTSTLDDSGTFVTSGEGKPGAAGLIAQGGGGGGGAKLGGGGGGGGACGGCGGAGGGGGKPGGSSVGIVAVDADALVIEDSRVEAAGGAGGGQGAPGQDGSLGGAGASGSNNGCFGGAGGRGGKGGGGGGGSGGASIAIAYRPAGAAPQIRGTTASGLVAGAAGVGGNDGNGGAAGRGGNGTSATLVGF